MFGIKTLLSIRRSVTFKIWMVTFFIYLLCTTIITLVHMIVSYIAEQKLIANEITQFAQTFKPAFAQALWDVDEQAIQDVFSVIQKSKLIVGVKIQPKDMADMNWSAGIVQDDMGNNIPGIALAKDKKGYLNTKLFTYSFTINALDMHKKLDLELGTAVIYSSDAIVLEKVKIILLFITINALVSTLVIGTLFLWAGKKYIADPLGSLARAVESVSIDKLEPIMVTERGYYKNELNDLEDSFNSMVVSLKFIIEEREHMMHTLEDSAKYYSAIFDSMPSALISVKADKRISHWNKMTEKITQIERNSAIGARYDEKMEIFTDQYNLINKSFTNLTIERKDKIKLNVGGEDKFFQFYVYPVQNQGVVIRADDITERVNLENIMVQTEKMTSLGTLAAGMAHEINNPLGSILQGIQNAQRRFDINLPKNKEVAEKYGFPLENMQKYMQERGITAFIEGVLDAGHRAANIVKNVLKFSRRSGSEMAATDINLMVEEAISIVSTDYDIKKQTKFKEMEVKKELDPKLQPVVCASSEIEQVLLNFIKNAAHAVSFKENNQKPTITVRTRQLVDSIIIEVEDNGTGIEEKHKKRLFEPFFTTKPVGIGTGLGLSISYYIIVDKHKGKLYVESEYGVGTKFIIQLPQTPQLQDKLNDEAE